MNQIEEDILALLQYVKSTGNFIASGTKKFMPIGLEVDGFGEVAVPITPLQAKSLIKVAHKAPFGKGSETILDDNVRKAWEIDAERVSFKNKEWNSILEDILKDVGPQLGVTDNNLTASFYKLLIYEKNDFFTWHKDSEKEADMFATLSITLPSEYEGGELAVRFQDKEVVIDMAKEAKDYKFAYTAFYADCDHEIRKLRKGYRISLVYNVLQKNTKNKDSAAATQSSIDELASLLEEWEKTIANENTPSKIILLDHQYTPTNFSAEHLKLSDRSKVQLMKQAAEKAGFFMRLGLVTHYISGELEYESVRSKGYGRRRRGWGYEFDYDEESLSSGTMGDEIFEEYSHLEHWAADGLPTLDKLKFEDNEVIANFVIGEDEPIEKQAEGYTGNAGMTMDYWYHYGAMVLWPKKRQKEILANLSMEKNLAWLDYYIEHLEQEPEAKNYIVNLLGNINVPTFTNPYTQSDFEKDTNANGFAKAWLLLNDEKAFEENSSHLISLFQNISIKIWQKLIKMYPDKIFDTIFEGVAKSNNLRASGYLAELLIALGEGKKLKTFTQKQVEKLPEYLQCLSDLLIPQPNYKYHIMFSEEHTKQLQKILSCLFELNLQNPVPDTWIDKLSAYFCSSKLRSYINTVLIPAFKMNDGYQKTALYQKIYTFVIEDLKHRVNNKPQPLPTWTREIPKHEKYYAKEWAILQEFMASPTEKVFNYRAVQKVRGNMESAIISADVDLEMETIRKGSPQTLCITKNQRAYQISLKEWEEDVKLLGSLEG